MLKWLSFLIILAIFTTGCGASPPETSHQDITSAETIGGCGSINSASMGLPGDHSKKLTHQPECFVFHTALTTREKEDGTILLYEQPCKADFLSEDPERIQFVDGILDQIESDYNQNSAKLHQYAEEFLSEYGAELFYSYSNYQNLHIARHDDAVVSLLNLSSIYSGGAHPSSIQTAYNMDIDDSRLLCLEDVIYPDRGEDLAQMVEESISDKFAPLGDSALFPEYRRTIASAMTYGSMTPYWYLSDTGLVVFFNQYELGPYAAGIIRAELDYAILEGILQEEYLPLEGNGEQTELMLLETAGSRKITTVTIEPGEELLVGTDGLVYQVRLSEVSWLNGTPISQNMIFSARTLCEEDVLKITGDFSQKDRAFCIEFKNGAGEQKLYYLGSDGLTTAP